MGELHPNPTLIFLLSQPHPVWQAQQLTHVSVPRDLPGCGCRPGRRGGKEQPRKGTSLQGRTERGASGARAPGWVLQAAVVLAASFNNCHFTDEETGSQTHTPMTEPTKEQAP